MTDEYVVVPFDDIRVNNCLNYIERPVAILDRKKKALHNNKVPLTFG